MKSLAVAILLAFAVALGTAAPASAAKIPCWKALINDWYDGRIDETYPRHCYSDAIRHLPRDVDTYSSAKDDIERALLDSIRNNSEPSWDPGEGAGGTSAAPGSDDDGSKSIITRAIEWLGPSNADAIPLPLLILAAVAFVLLAAAGGSVLSKKLSERRLPPPNS